MCVMCVTNDLCIKKDFVTNVKLAFERQTFRIALSKCEIITKRYHENVKKHRE